MGVVISKLAGALSLITGSIQLAVVTVLREKIHDRGEMAMLFIICGFVMLIYAKVASLKD